MPTIALFCGFIFIAWLLARDIRRRPGVSNAIWIPVVFLLILGSRPVSLWVKGGPAITHEMGNQVAGSLLDQLFYPMIYIPALLVVASRKFKWNKLFATNNAVLLLYLYFAISIVWSGDPTGSFKRLLKDFGAIAVIALIFSEKDPLQAIRAVYVRCACVLFPLSVILIKYFPSYSRVYALNGDITVTGVATQKNSLGELCLVFSLFLVWDCLETIQVGNRLRWKRLAWDYIALIIIAIWLLDLSHSKTALLCLTIGILLIVRRGRLDTRLADKVVLLAALSLPFLLFFSQQFSFLIAPIVEAMGRNMTFTGRANIWERITIATVNPFIGAGYWNFWGGPGGLAISQAMKTPIPNAHDGYLDLYIDGGFIGLTVLFTMLIWCGRQIIARSRKMGSMTFNYRHVSFAMLIIAIMYNLSESTFLRLGPIWFSTLLMIIEMPGLSIKANQSLSWEKSKNQEKRLTEGQTHQVLVNQ